jgi:GDPmannose 4,6-dehydratase
MKNAIITGITGQDGTYLANFLLNKGYSIIGLVRNNSRTNMRNLRYLDIDDKINFIKIDLLNISNIVRIVEKNEIDEIYNLAAQSSVGLSFSQPIETLEFNIVSTAKLLEAMRVTNPKIKFYQASSSEMFGNVKKENLPINENFLLRPISPYGISKAASHWITVNYREAHNLFAACGISFNHESVLRNKNFVTKKIINTAVKISLGLADELRLGNMKIYRDWGYAPKYVEAMWLMLQQDDPDDYIISSGEVHSLEEFVIKVFEKLNLNVDKFVKIDESLYRPNDLEINYGDNSKAKNKLNWNYDMSFDQLIDKLVDDEIEFIKWELENKKSEEY